MFCLDEHCIKLYLNNMMKMFVIDSSLKAIEFKNKTKTNLNYIILSK